MSNIDTASTRAVDYNSIASGPFLCISAHDYRSRRKAGMHFIARELSTRGATRFFSVGYSLLSSFTGDPRRYLASRSNRPEVKDSIECYLWQSPIHPFNVKVPALKNLESAAFSLYVASAPSIFDDWVRDSRTIIIESGLPVAFFRRVKSLNPEAVVIYNASDDLATIGCAPFLISEFGKTASGYDLIRLPSARLRESMPLNIKATVIPHGIDHRIEDLGKVSPYKTEINAVSIGSMIFDPTFFITAVQQFPLVNFYVIGAGAKAAELSPAPNLRVMEELPFEETIAYIRHATLGLAPYRGDKVSSYLADTSLKLAQFAYFGVPAVCPRNVVGSYGGRYGYTPGDFSSIATAIKSALDGGPIPRVKGQGWAEVADKMLRLGPQG